MIIHVQNARCSRPKPGFTVTLLIVAMLILMVALITANILAMNRLDREVRGIEKHQIQRLNPGTNVNHPRPATNLPAPK